MMKQEKYVAGLYCRLSRDDCQPGESVSIGTQRSMLLDFCEENGYEVFRETLFRRMLYCSECGHAMSAAYRRLTYTEDDSYRCTHHFTHPDECKKTHAVYHKPLYNHVLNEIRTLGKTMKRRKINSPIAEYADIDELTPEILQSVIRRIEIDYVGYKSKMSKVVHIDWNL